MHALAYTTTCAKREVVPDVHIGRSGGLGNSVVVVLVPFRFKATRIGVSLGAGGDCVGVINDSSTFGD